MKARSITIALTGALVASMLLTGCGNQKEEKEQGLSFETDITEQKMLDFKPTLVYNIKDYG